LVSRTFELPDEPVVELVLETTLRNKRIKFQDEDGDPIDLTFALVMIPGDTTGWKTTDLTDQEGVLVLGELGGGSVWVDLKPAFGRFLGRYLVDLTVDEDPIVVVTRPPASVGVSLVTRDTPIPGVVGVLLTTRCPFPVARGLSDPGGRILFDGMTQGDYLLRVNSAGYYPSEIAVNSDQEVTVEIRRTGALEIDATLGGLPWAGVSIELAYPEFPGLLADWARSRDLEQPVVLTDQSGRASLEGLPEGTYTWTVAGGELPQAGIVQVKPLGQASLHIVQ
jgi:hypothetical protein